MQFLSYLVAIGAPRRDNLERRPTPPGGPQTGQSPRDDDLPTPIVGVDGEPGHAAYHSQAVGVILGPTPFLLRQHRPRTIDQYGRTIADVILPDSRSMSRAMVQRGIAWWVRRYAPHDAALAQLEAKAREARIHLLSQPNPVPPWTWRRGGGVRHTTEIVRNRRTHVHRKPSCRRPPR
jgi:hypothetical protein